MALLSDFRYLIAPDVPGASNILIDSMVVRMCRKFCDQTHIWRYEHSPVMMISGISDYTLDDLPIDSEVAWLNTTRQGTHDVAVNSIDIAKKSNPSASAQTGSVARGLYMLDQSSFRVSPVPTGTAMESIAPDVALRPTLAATTVWDGLLTDWAETIAAGVLGRMMLQSTHTWSDPNVAAYHLIEFKAGVTEAKRRINSGFAKFNDTIQAGQSFI